jgi:hypothetical protein
MNKNNNKQNIDIARLEEKVGSLETRFNTFCSNEFEHLRSQVEKIQWTVVIGMVTTILIILLTKFFL